MASIMTLDGPIAATDEWGEQQAVTVTAFDGLTTTFLTWGVLAFAAATAYYRGREAIRGRIRSSSTVSGARRYRRRRR
jgi:hypothetical protein